MTSAVMHGTFPVRAEGVAIIHAPQSSSASVDELQLRDNADPSGLNQILGEPSSLGLLWLLQTAVRDGQIDLGKQDVEQRHQSVEALFAKVQEAIRKAHDAAENKGFFGELCDKFGVVGQVAVVVAAVASVVATGGASAIAIAALAGTLLSMGAKPLAEAFGGGETLAQVFQYTGIGISVLAGGAGLVQGLGTAGAQATTQGATVLKDMCRGVSVVATGAQGGASAVQGVTGYMRDSYAADELDARADELDARTTRSGMLEEIDRAIEFMRQVEQSFTASQSNLAEAMNVESESQLTLINLGARA